MTADVLTYSRTKGVFAGVSLEGASMDTDNDANKKVYGKTIDAKTIVTSDQAVPAAGKALVDLLDKTSPKRR
jgi:lipid-binding SYLF domain-containing protein